MLTPSDPVSPALTPEILSQLELPPETVAAVALQMVHNHHRGPLPPADFLASYRDVREDLPDQIIGWAHAQITHRLDLERVVTIGTERRKLIGQLGAFLVALVGMGFASFVGIYGNAWTAAVIATVAVGGPTAATILSSRLAVTPPISSSSTKPAGPKSKNSRTKRG